MNPVVEVRLISTAETIPLRHEILLPNGPVECLYFDGDNLETTRHFGGYCGDRLLAVGSVFLTPSGFQLRGMATAHSARGMGLGTAILRAAVSHARERAASLLWCNARAEAVGFYRRFGFEVIGERFEIPGVGPHFKMGLALTLPAAV
jgi:predicted GNAT family N-acyltransferase